MKMARWIIGLLGLLMLLALPAAGFAQEEVRGTGVLHATGDGVATIHGEPADYINISGDGSLYIVDRAGDASINVSGEGIRREFSWRGETVIAYQGFNGRAEISGSDVYVRLTGENIVLDAAGTGWVLLRGTGEFTVSRADGSHYSGHWLPEGARIEMTQE